MFMKQPPLRPRASASSTSMAMEQKLLSDLQQTLKTQTPLSLKPFSIATSLIANPSTTDQTISSLIQILSQSHLLLHLITLLSQIPLLRPHFSPITTTTLHSLAPNAPPRAAALALTTLVSDSDSDTVSETTHGLFLSLCFGSSVPVRHKLLLDVNKFNLRPSILLTVLLGFTKDPYPYVRKAALDGLIGLINRVVVDDRGMIEGCYLRGVELLCDTEECVRGSAVHVVSDWGKVLVAVSEDECKRELSDSLYVQLCSTARDMSKNVRIEAFNCLGKAETASHNLLMQTLSKKLLEENKSLGQHFHAQALTAAGAFLHGLEDEFYEVRSSACYSLRMPGILSADLAEKVLGLLMDVLNDDSTIVRLQALETLHHMARFGHLKVQEQHMHMFLGTLVDMNLPVRSTARKVLDLTKFYDMSLFKLAADSLISSLETYPQDEPDVLSLMFDMGRNHGSFAASITEDIFLEMEPSSASNWDFNTSKTAAMLTLAISIPLSHESQHHSYIIPPAIFSYAVTMLGRISKGLTEIMNQKTLLSYLSHCSTSTGPHHIPPEDDVATKVNHQISVSHVGDSLELHDDKEYNDIKFVLANVAEIWQPLIKLGYTSELLTALRGWMEELTTHITDSHQPSSILTFALQYLNVVKLLSKAWWHVMCPLDFIRNEIGDAGYNLQKLEKKLRRLRYGFIGLSREDELHIDELTLVACLLRSSLSEPRFARKKLLVYEEASMERSKFTTEVKKTLQKDEIDPYRFRAPLEFFSLRPLEICQDLRHVRAELEVEDNDWLKPVPFVAGLPVGIPLTIRLHNIPPGAKLWLKMSRSRESVHYVFIDLKEFDDDMREFRFVAPFYRTPKVECFMLVLCIGMECWGGEEIGCFGGPNHELVYICKEKQMFLSMVKR